MAAADASAPEHDPVADTAQALDTAPRAGADGDITVAVWTPEPGTEELVDQAFEAARSFAASGGTLLVLPELFCFPDGGLDDALEAAEVFVPVVRALCEACEGSGLHIATSLVEMQRDQPVHVGVLLSAAGIVARQPQLEAAERHPWATLGERQAAWRMPYGRLAMLVGDDALHAERVRSAEEQADILACVSGQGGASAAWGETPEVLRIAQASGVCVVAAVGSEEGGGGFVTGRAVGPVHVAAASENDALPNFVRASTMGGLTRATITLGERRNMLEVAEPTISPVEPDEQEHAVDPPVNADNIPAAGAPTEMLVVGSSEAEPRAEVAPAADHEATPDDLGATNALGEPTERLSKDDEVR